MKLYVERSKLDVGKFFFSQRVVPYWNGLPEDFVTAPSANAFKNPLYKQ